MLQKCDPAKAQTPCALRFSKKKSSHPATRAFDSRVPWLWHESKGASGWVSWKKNENPRARGDHASAGLIKPNERQTGAHKKVMRKWVAACGLEESCNVSLFLWWSSSFYYQSHQGTITLCPGIDWATKFGSPLHTSQSVLSLISILGFWLPAFVCSQNSLRILQLYVGIWL